MPDSMFSREVALRLEKENNAFSTCRSLSIRARDINGSRKARDINMEIVPSEPNASASAMIDLADERISFYEKASE
jgi:hypothetical protein